MSGFQHSGSSFGFPRFVRFAAGPPVIDGDSCLQLTDTAPLADQLLGLLEGLADFTAAWDAEVTVSLEPNGDACDTGIQLLLVVAGDVWRARVNPSPWTGEDGRPGPDEMHAELTVRGWDCGDAAVPGDDEPGRDRSGRERFVRLPELRTDRRDGLTTAFVAEVVDVLVAHCGARTAGWFVWDGDLTDPLTVMLDEDGEPVPPIEARWTVHIADLLPEEWTEIAVWPAGSEGAAIMCELGEHTRHVPPCRDGRFRVAVDDEDPATPALHSCLCFDTGDFEDFDAFLVDEVRLTDAAPLLEQLDFLFNSMTVLSLEFDLELETFVSPTARGQADGCQLMFGVVGQVWIAELSSVPIIHGGAIPDELAAVLVARGWVRPDPTTPPGPAALRRRVGIGHVQQGEPNWRLVADRSADDSDAFVREVVWAAINILGAPPSSWVIGPCLADAARSERLGAIAAVWNHGDDWKVALDELLPEGWTCPTVWPSWSPRAVHACIAGRHDRHEPPCC